MATLGTARIAHRSSPPPAFAPPDSEVPQVSQVVRIAEDAFLAEAAVDAWTRNGAAKRVGPLLTLADGRRYGLRDAVRVLGRRNGDTDPYGFTGSVETLRELIRRGATISADALRLGPAVYDIEYGYLAAPCDGV